MLISGLKGLNKSVEIGMKLGFNILMVFFVPLLTVSGDDFVL